jgi:hypothetical protein
VRVGVINKEKLETKGSEGEREQGRERNRNGKRGEGREKG